MRQPVIPDYVMLRPVGRGAYGEVWLARNVVGTLRAVKVLWRRQFESDRPFEREFAGIQLYEPVSRASGGLVHVLHVGRNEAEKYFYYVMELADPAEIAPPVAPGEKPSAPEVDRYEPRTLRSDLKRRGPLSIPESLRLAVDVASGLARLHRHGLVHRDVKPANIIYVNGRAKLADIGLVAADGVGKTFVGTEGYIPPEGPGSNVADLYALGMVLYQASTGFTPDRFPDVPPDWVGTPGNEPALEFYEVVLKACEGQRERRYQSAEEMQADLALLESGESVRQKRAQKRRYDRLRASIAVVTLLLASSVVITISANYRARLAAASRTKEKIARERTERALVRAEAAEHEARQQLYTALLAQARATVRSGDLGQRVQALDAVRRAGGITNTADVRGAALAALALPDLRFESEIPMPSGATLAYMDPAGERIAFCFGDNDVEIRTVAARFGRKLPASARATVGMAKWSGDGRYLWVRRNLVATAAEANLEVWDVAAAKRVLLLEHVQRGAAAFHPRLPQIIAGLRGGIIAVFDLETGNELRRWPGVETPWTMGFSPDGQRFAAWFEHPGPAIAVHSAITGERQFSQPVGDLCTTLDWHPDGRWIAAACHDGLVELIDSLGGEPRILGRHKVQAAQATFSPDGNYLISGGWERELICWDLRRMQRAFTVPLNSFRMQFRSDGRQWAIQTEANTIQFHGFDVPTACREFPEDLGNRLLSAAFSPDGRWLAVSGNERVGLWDLHSKGPAARVPEGADGHVFFSGQGDLFAYNDERPYRWKYAAAGDPRFPPMLKPYGPPMPAGFMSLCLASSNLVSTAENGTSLANLQNFANVAADQSLRVKTSAGVNGASADARWLAIYVPYSPHLEVYRLPELKLITNLTTSGRVANFQFSPRGGELAVSSFSGVDLFDTKHWGRRTLTNAISLLYAPEEQTVWLTHDFRSAGLYEARTLESLLPLPPGSFPLALSPDGRYLAVRLDGRRLQVWDLAQARDRLRELGVDWPR